MPVEVQNYIDDTGVQVADVVVGFQRARAARRSTRSARSPTRRASTTTAGTSTPASPSGTTATRRGSRSAQRDAARHRARRQRHRRARRLHRRPHRPLPPEDDGAAERRLRPADVGGRHPAPEVLGAGVRGAEARGRRLPADRRAAGRLLGDADRRGRWRRQRRSRAPKPPATTPSEPDRGRREQREKVIVRSNGTVTYVGKDIAYQFWKLGLLGKDFHYRAVRRRAATATPLWATTSDAGGDGATIRRSARAAAVYNVIDVAPVATCRSC